MPIARNEVVSSLGNSDDRPSRLEFLPRQTVVEKTLEVKSGHIRVVRVVPPCLATELRPVIRRHCVLLRSTDMFEENNLRYGSFQNSPGSAAIESPVFLF